MTDSQGLSSAVVSPCVLVVSVTAMELSSSAEGGSARPNCCASYLDNVSAAMRLRPLTLRPLTLRSLRDLFCTIIIVASVSVVVTYQLSKYLPPRQQTELKIQFNGRVDIYREQHDDDGGGALDDMVKQKLARSQKGLLQRQGLEGMDLEAAREMHDGKTGGHRQPLLTRGQVSPQLRYALSQVGLVQPADVQRPIFII